MGVGIHIKYHAVLCFGYGKFRVKIGELQERRRQQDEVEMIKVNEIKERKEKSQDKER